MNFVGDPRTVTPAQPIAFYGGVKVTFTDANGKTQVKAGMDPLLIKQQYGDKLVLNGGLNAAIWGDFDKFAAEMERLIPALKKGGGYICSSDHSVPESVSLETFRRTVELAKKLGSYE